MGADVDNGSHHSARVASIAEISLKISKALDKFTTNAKKIVSSCSIVGLPILLQQIVKMC